MSIDTWVSLAALMSAFSGLYLLLRRDIGSVRTELKGDISELRNRIDDSESRLRSDLK